MYKSIQVCKDYDVPYVGGYNTDGTIVYIDRHLPSTFLASTKVIVDLHKYLIIHEITEINLIRNLDLSYNEAHKIAVGAEMAALQKDGCPVDEYYAHLYRHIDKKLLPQNIKNVALDLDLRPYREDELTEVLRAISRIYETKSR